MTDHKDSEIVQSEDLLKDHSGTATHDAITAYRSYNADDLAAIEKRLRRKLDLRIMPPIFIIYVMNYLDRNSITQARLYGLEEDANISGAMWQTAISILSVGYIAMQIPFDFVNAESSTFNLFVCMIIWAIVSGCTAFVSSPAGLLTVRFLLGIAEAPFFPCAIYYLSCWYPKAELGKRMALLVSGIIVSNVFAGLLSAGILGGLTHVDVCTWSWLFIIEGLMTIIIAIAAIFLLPDYPKNTKWLTLKEKQVAQARLALDIGSEDVLDEHKVPVLQALWQAGKDYHVWIFAIMQMSTTASISYSHFFPTLLEVLGYEDNTITLLLTSPPYVLAFFWAISMATIADRTHHRSPFAGISCVFALIGGIVAVALPEDSRWPRYVAMFLLCSGTYGIYTTTYTWLSSTIPQPPAKRAASIGIANSLANLASFYGNYFWLDKYGPGFTESWTIVIAFLALAEACMIALRISLSRSNKKFDRLCEQYVARDLDVRGLDADELRAVQNGFRYVLWLLSLVVGMKHVDNVRGELSLTGVAETTYAILSMIDSAKSVFVTPYGPYISRSEMFVKFCIMILPFYSKPTLEYARALRGANKH